MRRSIAGLLVVASLFLGLPAAGAAQAMGTISGSVTGNGSALETTVNAFDLDGNSVGFAQSDASGDYSMTVPVGAYRLRFSGFIDHDPSGTGFGWLEEWYDDQADFASATAVTVTSGGTVTADADLAPGAAIEITVRDAASTNPIANANVWVQETKEFGYVSTTDTNGVIRISGVNPVAVRVLAMDGNTPVQYRYEWFDEGDDYDTATQVVLSPSLLTSVTVELDQGFASIAGLVSDEITALGISGVAVTALPLNGSIPVGTAFTDGTGSYILDGLRAGDYKVFFDGYVGPDFLVPYRYQSEWYDDALQQTASTAVSGVLNQSSTADAALDYERCDGKPITIWDGSYNASGDVVTFNGTPFADVIKIVDDPAAGPANHTVINGLGGNDTICGSDVQDIIDGGAGSDTIFGLKGPDIILGNGGGDILYGGSGDDAIYGGDGGTDANDKKDTIRGGNGADAIWAGKGGDDVKGGKGKDDISGGTGKDVLHGQNGADTVRGGKGKGDLVKGGGGNDSLYGGGGALDDCRGGLGSADTAAGSCEIVSSVP